MRSRGTRSRRAQAIADPMVPMLLTACQPPTDDCSGAERASFRHSSKPTMNAAITSAGVAPVLSASGSSAGMIGEVG
jgi:hypothetical protein